LPEVSDDLDVEARRLAALQRLGDTVQTIHATGTIPILFGGDSRLVGLGLLAGLQQGGARPGIAWFDSDARLEPNEALDIALEPGGKKMADDLGLVAGVPPWHILIAGIRNISATEAARMEDTAMTAWDAEDLNEGGAQELGRDMGGWPPAILQVDLGVLDPAIMPAVFSPAAGGLSLASLTTSLEGVMAGGHVVAVGISNYVPSKDQYDLGLATSINVFRETVRILTI
jgi:arginase